MSTDMAGNEWTAAQLEAASRAHLLTPAEEMAKLALLWHIFEECFGQGLFTVRTLSRRRLCEEI